MVVFEAVLIINTKIYLLEQLGDLLDDRYLLCMPIIHPDS
jgi:hypothetical protein